MIFEDLNPPYFSIFQAQTWKWKISHFHLLFDEKCFKYSIGVIYQWNGNELLLPTKGFNKYSMNLYPSKSQLNLRFFFSNLGFSSYFKTLTVSFVRNCPLPPKLLSLFRDFIQTYYFFNWFTVFISDKDHYISICIIYIHSLDIVFFGSIYFYYFYTPIVWYFFSSLNE